MGVRTSQNTKPLHVGGLGRHGFRVGCGYTARRAHGWPHNLPAWYTDTCMVELRSGSGFGDTCTLPTCPLVRPSPCEPYAHCWLLASMRSLRGAHCLIDSLQSTAVALFCHSNVPNSGPPGGRWQQPAAGGHGQGGVDRHRQHRLQQGGHYAHGGAAQGIPPAAVQGGGRKVGRGGRRQSSRGVKVHKGASQAGPKPVPVNWISRLIGALLNEHGTLCRGRGLRDGGQHVWCAGR